MANAKSIAESVFVVLQDIADFQDRLFIGLLGQEIEGQGNFNRSLGTVIESDTVVKQVFVTERKLPAPGMGMLMCWRRSWSIRSVCLPCFYHAKTPCV